MGWEIVGDLQLARYFEGENVWEKKWVPVSEGRVLIFDQNGNQLSLPVWECVFGGQRKRFAADEVSNNLWVFALPTSAAKGDAAKGDV